MIIDSSIANIVKKEFGRAVIIGLGGSGASALLQIKRLFLEHCGQMPPCIRLLHFDTDNAELSLDNSVVGPVALTEDEFCHMPINSISHAITSDFVRDWWISDSYLNRASVSAGTGGVREVGRLAVFVNIDTIRLRLQTAFNAVNAFTMRTDMDKANMKLLDSSPQVIVIGSFAGGTGSGTFVDFSILCRLLGGKVLDGKSFFYSAYFILPRIYAEKARTHAYQNSYAALLELERLNKLSIEQPYEVQYGPDASLRFRLDSPPYHMVNLVDAKCIDGTVIDDPEQLFRFVGESIFNVVGALGPRAKSVVDNIMNMKSHVQPSDWNGCHAIYSCFGIGTLTYPARKIRQGVALGMGIELIDEVLQRLTGVALPTTQANEKEVGPFLQQHNLYYTNVCEKLLPAGSVADYQKDDGLNLSDDGLADAIRQSVDFWEHQSMDLAVQILQRNAEKLRESTKKLLQGFLDELRAAEEKGQREKGTYEAAVKLLVETLKGSRQALSDATNPQTLEKDLKRWQSEGEQKYGAFPERRPKFFWQTGPVKNLYSEYVAARKEVFDLKLKAEVYRVAMALFDEWVKLLEGVEGKLLEQKNAREKAKSNLEQLKSRLLAERSLYTSERLRASKSLFEVFVGDRDEKGRTLYYYSQSALPPGSALYDEYQKALGVAKPDELAQKPLRELEQQLRALVMEKTKGLLDVSVMDILKRVEEEEPGESARLIKRALENAKLLLPLNTDEHAGKGLLLAKFCVTGGAPMGDAEKDQIEPFIPADQRVHNLWASTGDKHRITFCTFFSVAPAANVLGLEQMRDAYLERIFPPTHTDRRMLFRFPDLLPPSPSRLRALRLLSLAMLPNIGVITHERPSSGSTYFLLHAPTPSGMAEPPKHKQNLPGRPGRFYDLWAELARDTKLMDKVEDLVLQKAKAGLSPNDFLAEVSQQLRRFEDILDNMREGLRLPDVKPFNKMITGWLYQQQVDFLQRVLNDKVPLQEAIKMKIN